ncbi:hypothetical protein OG562_44895 [Streptomyces sp. NBC_01275]|nr:hypothetical protein [Streptomyces sp. NBC_01275]MCX4767953.1 hypothetical protein [Streptomyces sp. NBC_01275]
MAQEGGAASGEADRLVREIGARVPRTCFISR